MSLQWLCYVPGDRTPELRSVMRRGNRSSNNQEKTGKGDEY
ncbi:hypothetical protein SNOG_04701 [Parastagonospora nodorum SN15]|uniref:Uncharacterized protein n=1 Tax=Phaeosphaeria nodorum (strain SN15 / ATCC MYA-4574 / FGSC 10173) TaxID=321614 RepID=Q0UU63_PHANO|nr:hypothetical protein SNOG_04701 [Parastagonospora nodorum SN15]EAT88461.1 hypothetical protein SNOG_04701 [Parastagonospora nodorum SN15]